MKQPLTSKQQEIYLKIQAYFKEHYQSPTLEELKTVTKTNSINTVVQYLKALEQKGYIIRRKHAKRNIEIKEEENGLTLSIPVLSSAGCDNLSVFADQRNDEFIEIDKKIIGNRNNVVAVRAVGDSMNDADIQDGDYVLIEPVDHAENGDRVAVIVGDMLTIKKLEKHDDFVVLRPESKDTKYKPIVLHNDSKIAGKVICSIPGQSMDITDVFPIKEEKY